MCGRGELGHRSSEGRSTTVGRNCDQPTGRGDRPPAPRRPAAEASQGAEAGFRSHPGDGRSRSTSRAPRLGRVCRSARWRPAARRPPIHRRSGAASQPACSGGRGRRVQTRRSRQHRAGRSLRGRASDARNSAKMWPVGWEALEQWGDDVARNDPLAGGVANDVRSVRVNGHLAVGRLGARSDADLAWETELLQHLDREGLTVPVFSGGSLVQKGSLAVAAHRPGRGRNDRGLRGDGLRQREAGVDRLRPAHPGGRLEEGRPAGPRSPRRDSPRPPGQHHRRREGGEG